jgi:hypothetical protein
MNSISTGRHTDLRFVDENPLDSIRRSNESDSIKTDESGPLLLKQKEPIISTVAMDTVDFESRVIRKIELAQANG